MACNCVIRVWENEFIFKPNGERVELKGVTTRDGATLATLQCGEYYVVSNYSEWGRVDIEYVAIRESRLPGLGRQGKPNKSPV